MNEVSTTPKSTPKCPFWRKRKEATLFFIIVLFMTGCVTPGPISVTPGPMYTWKIKSYSQSVENDYFYASISPTSLNNILDGYQAFDLTIKNKTSDDIELDWNKTLYIENNQTKGGFMFDGVVYKDRNNPKLPDIIFSGFEFRKTIWPNVFASFYREWHHDAIPPGQNGVYLTIRIKDKEVNEKMLLDMRRVYLPDEIREDFFSEEEVKTVVIAEGSFVPLKSRPDSYGALIKTLMKNDEIKIFGKKSGWLKVETLNGEKGWVKENDLNRQY